MLWELRRRPLAASAIACRGCRPRHREVIVLRTATRHTLVIRRALAIRRGLVIRRALVILPGRTIRHALVMLRTSEIATVFATVGMQIAPVML